MRLDPEIIGHKYATSFKAQYCIMGGQDGRQIVSHRNIDQFNALVGVPLLIWTVGPMDDDQR